MKILKKNLIKYLLLLIIVLMSVTTKGENISDYNRWMKLDSKELLDRAAECKNRGSIDSALVYFSIVSNRTETSDLDEIKYRCLAYVEKAMIYFTTFSDYTKAFENLVSAIELKNESGLEYSYVDNTAAILYHVVAVTCRDWNMERKAMEMCKQAYDTSLNQGNKNDLHVYVTNIIIMSCNLNESATADEVWKTYRNDRDTTYNYRFNEMMYTYLTKRVAGEYEDAIKESENMIRFAQKHSDERRMIISYNAIVEVLEKNGNYQEALEHLNRQEELANKYNMREKAMELINIKERLYRKLGQEDLANTCSRMYYMKKDSLLNLKQMNNITRTIYNGESRKMEKVITEITVKNDMYKKVFLIVLVFMVILLSMVVMLRIKIKELKKSNITIYENNVENIKHEQKEREKLKDEVLKLEHDESVEEAPPAEVVEENNDDEKYKNNYLSDDEKKMLLDKILTVMENVEEICSESFSVTRLAELTGSKYNYVSLVINENYGCNFNNFLNKFRIKEACRRLADDENYGNYTIDAISNSLGFKSRTTLVTSFKKIVGLTPSQYRSIAKEKKIESEE